jgi:hypothetical protein
MNLLFPSILNKKNSYIAVLWLVMSWSVNAQTVYKTPSGEKYHTATCRYVKNVSEKIEVSSAQQQGLSPCSMCKPPIGTATQSDKASSQTLGLKSNEAQGESKATQCAGKTKSGARCKRTTRNSNGYCFQHER